MTTCKMKGKDKTQRTDTHATSGFVIVANKGGRKIHHSAFSLVRQAVRQIKT